MLFQPFESLDFLVFSAIDEFFEVVGLDFQVGNGHQNLAIDQIGIFQVLMLRKRLIFNYFL